MNLAHRTVASLLASLVLGLVAPAAHAQDTPIKFQLDWRFEGPGAMFLVPLAKGYFKAEKLDVTIDAGNGSGGAVTRVALRLTTTAFLSILKSTTTSHSAIHLYRKH